VHWQSTAPAPQQAWVGRTLLLQVELEVTTLVSRTLVADRKMEHLRIYQVLVREG